eukprot:jgi/Bigna1/90355/estExt_fgenesh1_pg.C_680017
MLFRVEGVDDNIVTILVVRYARMIEMEKLHTLVLRACRDGALDKTKFQRLMTTLLPRDTPNKIAAPYLASLSSLFDLFDTNDDDVVDRDELLSGLTLLSQGSLNERLQVVFALVDKEGNGYISPNEMWKFFKLSMLVQMALSDETSNQYSKKVLSEIAGNTAAEAVGKMFREASMANRSKGISYDEFKAYCRRKPHLISWISIYDKIPEAESGHPLLKSPVKKKRGGGAERSRFEIEDDAGGVEQPPFSSSIELKTNDGKSIVVTSRKDRIGEFQSLRQALGPEKTQEIADDLLRAFQREATSGCVNRTQFKRIMANLLFSSGGANDSQNAKIAYHFDRIFDMFDVSGTGVVVDTGEFVTGMLIFSNGGRMAKLQLAFGMFDIDKNGFISRDEMFRFIETFLRVCVNISDPSSGGGGGASIGKGNLAETVNKIALESTDEFFELADVNNDDNVSWTEFVQFYNKYGRRVKWLSLLNEMIPIDNDSVGEEVDQKTSENRRQPSKKDAKAVDVKLSIPLPEGGVIDIRDNDVTKFRFLRTIFSKVAPLLQHRFSECKVLGRTEFMRTMKSILPRDSLSPALRSIVDLSLYNLFNAFDYNADGVIDGEEFMRGMVLLQASSKEQTLQLIFDMIDADRNGKISMEEMCDFFSSFLLMTCAICEDAADLPAEYLQDVVFKAAHQVTESFFYIADTNEDGWISWHEFVTVYENDRHLVPWLQLLDIADEESLQEDAIEKGDDDAGRDDDNEENEDSGYDDEDAGLLQQGGPISNTSLVLLTDDVACLSSLAPLFRDIPPDKILEAFRREAGKGYLDRVSFSSVMAELFYKLLAEDETLSRLFRNLFNLFDQNARSSMLPSMLRSRTSWAKPETRKTCIVQTDSGRISAREFLTGMWLLTLPSVGDKLKLVYIFSNENEEENDLEPMIRPMAVTRFVVCLMRVAFGGRLLSHQETKQLKDGIVSEAQEITECLYEARDTAQCGKLRYVDFAEAFVRHPFAKVLHIFASPHTKVPPTPSSTARMQRSDEHGIRQPGYETKNQYYDEKGKKGKLVLERGDGVRFRLKPQDVQGLEFLVQNLGGLTFTQLMNTFVHFAKNGALNKEQFNAAIDALVPAAAISQVEGGDDNEGAAGEEGDYEDRERQSKSRTDAWMLRFVLHRLFEVFDSNNDGAVDCFEFLSGLKSNNTYEMTPFKLLSRRCTLAIIPLIHVGMTLFLSVCLVFGAAAICLGFGNNAGINFLLNSDIKQKLTVGFIMVDSNGDGYIEMEELFKFFISFYSLVAAISSEARALSTQDLRNLVVDASQASARALFAAADSKRRGKISLAEFVKAYVSDNELVPWVRLFVKLGAEETRAGGGGAKRNQDARGGSPTIKLAAGLPTPRVSMKKTARFNDDVDEEKQHDDVEAIPVGPHSSTRFVNSPEEEESVLLQIAISNDGKYLYLTDDDMEKLYYIRNQLKGYSAKDLLNIFDMAADAGSLDHRGFISCLRSLIPGEDLDEDEKHHLEQHLQALFYVFDRDLDGLISVHEFLCGLYVFCEEPPAKKLAVLFSLVDMDEDDMIDADELRLFYRSILAALVGLSSWAHSVVPVSHLSQLLWNAAAIKTAEFFDCAGAAMEEEDAVSFTTFCQILTKFPQTAPWLSIPDDEDQANDDEESNTVVISPRKAARMRQSERPRMLALTAQDVAAIEAIAQSTQFRDMDLKMMLRAFATVAKTTEAGTEVNKAGFTKICRDLVPGLRSDDEEGLRSFAELLFLLLDRNQNGRIDVTELTVGLSIFLKGNATQRLRLAFDLCDSNADGNVDWSEMYKVQSSSLSVLLAFAAESQSLSNAIPKLQALVKIRAKEATDAVFELGDTNNDGLLSFDEFAALYANHPGLLPWMHIYNHSASSSSPSELKEAEDTTANSPRVMLRDSDAFGPLPNNGESSDEEEDDEEKRKGYITMRKSNRYRAPANNDESVMHKYYYYAAQLTMTNMSRMKITRRIRIIHEIPDCLLVPHVEQLRFIKKSSGLSKLSPETIYDELKTIATAKEGDSNYTVTRKAFLDWIVGNFSEEKHKIDWETPPREKQGDGMRTGDGAMSPRSSERAVKMHVLSFFGMIFDSLDYASYQRVPTAELAFMLCGFCGGNLTSKLKVAFHMFDEDRLCISGFKSKSILVEIATIAPAGHIYDRDERISKMEMFFFLRTLIAFVLTSTARSKDHMVKLEETCNKLAQEATVRIFDVADSNNDGSLNFDEFYELCLKHPELCPWIQIYLYIHECISLYHFGNLPKVFQVFDEDDDDDEDEEEEGEGGDNLQGNDAERLGAASSSNVDGVEDDGEMKEGTSFDPMSTYSPRHVVANLKRAKSLFSLIPTRHLLHICKSNRGAWRLHQFQELFTTLIQSSLKQVVLSKEERNGLAHDLEMLFHIFDADGNEEVDTWEFVSGIFLLLDGTARQKLDFAFGLFDKEGSGLISRVELFTLFIAFVRVLLLYSLSEKISSKPTPAVKSRIEEIAYLQARKAVDAIFDKIGKSDEEALPHSDVMTVAMDCAPWLGMLDLFSDAEMVESV